MSEWGRLQDALNDEFDRQGVTGVDVDKVIEHIVNLRDFFPGLLLGAAPRAEGVPSEMTDEQRPMTEAGRDTLDNPYFAPPGTPFYDAFRERIFAIEREAAQGDGKRLDWVEYTEEHVTQADALIQHIPRPNRDAEYECQCGWSEAVEYGKNDDPGSVRWLRHIPANQHRRAQQCSACQHVTCSECGFVVPPDELDWFISHVCFRPFDEVKP